MQQAEATANRASMNPRRSARFRRSAPMRTVVAYDVADDAQRERISRILLEIGDRVQKSVFECVLTAAQRDRLFARLERLLEFRLATLVRTAKHGFPHGFGPRRGKRGVERARARSGWRRTQGVSWNVLTRRVIRRIFDAARWRHRELT